jgi:hypothetical protein
MNILDLFPSKFRVRLFREIVPVVVFLERYKPESDYAGEAIEETLDEMVERFKLTKEQAVEIYKECHNSGVNGHKSFYDIGAFFDERGYYEK